MASVTKLVRRWRLHPRLALPSFGDLLRFFIGRCVEFETPPDRNVHTFTKFRKPNVSPGQKLSRRAGARSPARLKAAYIHQLGHPLANRGRHSVEKSGAYYAPNTPSFVSARMLGRRHPRGGYDRSVFRANRVRCIWMRAKGINRHAPPRPRGLSRK